MTARDPEAIADYAEAIVIAVIAFVLAMSSLIGFAVIMGVFS